MDAFSLMGFAILVHVFSGLPQVIRMFLLPISYIRHFVPQSCNYSILRYVDNCPWWMAGLTVWRSHFEAVSMKVSVLQQGSTSLLLPV